MQDCKMIKILCTFFLFFLICGCHNIDNRLLLIKADIGKEDELDTLESYTARDLHIVQVVRHSGFDDFSLHYGVLTHSRGRTILYEMIGTGKYGKRISKEFIAEVEPYGKTNWGWFSVKNGKLSDTLPGMSKILLGLESENSKGEFIKETNGYINFYLNGKTVKETNYGDYVIKDSALNFSSMKYGLYKLYKGSLKLVGKNGNDIFKKKDGVFFIPQPGYGVINKYQKSQILDAVDSAVHLGGEQKKIWIKPEN